MAPSTNAGDLSARRRLLVLAICCASIVVVVMDQLVTSPAPYQVENNQVEYGTVGMEWLARQLHGKGNVVIVRGIAGAPAYTDRENGIRIALKKYPGIHVIGEIYSEWNPVTALQRISTFLPAHPKIDGWWTSGVGGQVVQLQGEVRFALAEVVGHVVQVGRSRFEHGVGDAQELAERL